MAPGLEMTHGVFGLSSEIRKVMYTTNGIELLTYFLRKLFKSGRAFPTDESILKFLFLSKQ